MPTGMAAINVAAQRRGAAGGHVDDGPQLLGREIAPMRLQELGARCAKHVGDFQPSTAHDATSGPSAWASRSSGLGVLRISLLETRV